MALKRQFPTLDTFSMSSMTDVIFLLLIFFMVTSTIIFPAAIEVNLPQSTEQTSLKPVTEVYLDSLQQLYIVIDRNSDTDAEARKPRPVHPQELMATLALLQREDSLRAVALYADSKVDYGSVVEVLDMAAKNRLKMVLATRASQSAPSDAPVQTPVLTSTDARP